MQLSRLAWRMAGQARPYISPMDSCLRIHQTDKNKRRIAAMVSSVELQGL